MPDSKDCEQAYQDARQEVRNLTVMAMRPDLLPDKRELIKALERSARAEVRLRLKHLRWLKSQRTGG